MKKFRLLVAVVALISGCCLLLGNSSASAATLSSLKPKQVAATVLVAGAKKNAGWRSFVKGYQDDDMDLSVLVSENNSSVQDNYSQPGTGTAYAFELDDSDQGMLNDYTISSDGKYVYCYQQPFHDSADRQVSPFLVLPASKILAMQHSASANEINDIANNIKIEVGD